MKVRTVLITGGAGFIGSHVVRLFVAGHPEYRIVNLDALTYAGNLENLSDMESASNHQFVHADITDEQAIDRVFSEHAVDAVIHLAAESHVDRSILDPLSFIRTNVMGTAVLLNTARKHWKDRSDVLFYHVSTDEVYGSLGDTGLFTEETPYDPPLALFSLQGFIRPPGESLPPYLWTSRRTIQLLQQLRIASVPGEAHPTDDQQHRAPEAPARVR